MRAFKCHTVWQQAVASLVLLITALLALPVAADDARPFYIEVNEQASSSSTHHYKVQWRVPPLIPRSNYPALDLPEACQAVGQRSILSGAGPQPALSRLAFTQAEGLGMVRCQAPLAGRRLELRYPQAAPALSTLVKYAAQSGERHTQLLAPGQGQWRIPTAETALGVARDYTLLGIEHIWAGLDHLLFVLCLIWIAGSPRRILITITGFTLAHSLTLVLSSLRWVQVPVPPVEAVIALSIVFLAMEIVKQNRDTLTWRHPIAVSTSFGLLHGFGFAAALSDIGLPQTELLTGLLFFNVGVEIGQVLFAAAVMLLLALVRRSGQRWLQQNHQHRVRTISAYGVGGVACFWLLERMAGF